MGAYGIPDIPQHLPIFGIRNDAQLLQSRENIDEGPGRFILFQETVESREQSLPHGILQLGK